MNITSEVNGTILCVGPSASSCRDLAESGFQIAEIRAEGVAAALHGNPDAVVVVRDRRGKENLSRVLAGISGTSNAPAIVYFSERAETTAALADASHSLLHIHELSDDLDEVSVAREAVLHTLIKASLAKAG